VCETVVVLSEIVSYFTVLMGLHGLVVRPSRDFGLKVTGLH
jgi:hypothetical protein